jgi:hypothetical protein
MTVASPTKQLCALKADTVTKSICERHASSITFSVSTDPDCKQRCVQEPPVASRDMHSQRDLLPAQHRPQSTDSTAFHMILKEPKVIAHSLISLNEQPGIVRNGRPLIKRCGDLHEFTSPVGHMV